MSGNLRALLDSARNAKDEDEPIEAVSPQPMQNERTGQSDSPVKRSPGRPPGKRSDPEWERLNLLVRKSTRLKVDMKLLQEPNAAENLSELVDRLLAQWAE